MKEIAHFIIGSKAFFDGMPGYYSHDIDHLYIMSPWIIPGNVLNMRKDGVDNFFMAPLTKEEHIQDALHQEMNPMRAGKYLVPEFAGYLGMTIEDLKRMEDLFLKMDDKHRYETMIYKYYIENSGFFLTEEQRENAYQEYKLKRK